MSMSVMSLDFYSVTTPGEALLLARQIYMYNMQLSKKTKMEGLKEPVIIDTDVGVDDALAIELLLRNNDVKLILITLVFGNVSPDVGLRALNLLLDDISIVRLGSEKALLNHVNYPSWVGHGVDGLGGSYEAIKSMRSKNDDNVKLSCTDHASVSIVETVTKFWKENNPVTVLAIGPLTNIALACLLDKNLCEKVGKLVIMGGCLVDELDFFLSFSISFSVFIQFISLVWARKCRLCIRIQLSL